MNFSLREPHPGFRGFSPRESVYSCMEKHPVIGSSLYGEFDIYLLVTKQAALLIVYLMSQSQAYENLERFGQLRGARRRLVSTTDIPLQGFIYPPTMHSVTGQTHELLWVEEPWGSCWS